MGGCRASDQSRTTPDAQWGPVALRRAQRDADRHRDEDSPWISWQEPTTILGRLILDVPAFLDDAWSELHDATPAGWFVGQPAYDEGRKVWEQYAFDPRDRARAGVRSREWTTAAPTELEVILALARCLRLIREGRVPTLWTRRPSLSWLDSLG